MWSLETVISQSLGFLGIVALFAIIATISLVQDKVSDYLDSKKK